VAVLALSTTLTACGATRTVTRETVASSRASAVNTLLAQGIAQAKANQLAQAATTFKDVLAVSPTNKYALYNLGVIAQERRDPSAALARYDQALKADTTYTPAMYNKALILEMRDPSQSLALYRRIVGLNPRASTAYLRMAIVYARQDKTAKAKQARARAIALDPGLASYPMPSPCSTATC
jgi:tetratricopeptide (TPR) repeat protein